MAARAVEPPGRRPPWGWAGAILLLGTLVAGLVGAAVLLWRFVDVDSLLEAAEADAAPEVTEVAAEVPLPPLPDVQPWSALLYESRASAAFFPDRGYAARLAARWEALLAGAGASVRRVSGAAAIDSLATGSTLVVPAGVCLADEERDAIHRHIERGGHLLATWAVGARDEACEWLGYGFLRDLAGAEAAGVLEGGPPSYIVLPHGSVIAAGLPPGSRIELTSEPWITLRADEPAVFFSDWVLNPLAGPGGGVAGAAIARVTPWGGRIVWFGYRLDVAASAADQRLLDRLARNGALWVSGHVLAEIEPWPQGYGAALSLTQDVEHGFKNARRMAARFGALRVPVTYFVVTRLAREHPELAALLAASGELGSHSVDHRQSAGRPWDAQFAGIIQARDEITSWAGMAPQGFRPPREVYDSLTLEAWRRSGGLYLAASNGARTAVPQIFALPSGPVVVLPRVVDDDYAVMVSRGQFAPDSLAAAFRAGLEKMRWLGGLDLVTVHSQLIDSERRVDAVESALRAAQDAGDVWVARASEVAEWWLLRASLQMDLREREDGSFVIWVRNAGPVAVRSAWLHVFLPQERASYAAPELGDVVLESHYEAWGLRVRLPEVAPGASHAILLPRRRA
jgi:peptidoglycan/xylan/chitin deacetylase (PgdA/CDA1 family)